MKRRSFLSALAALLPASLVAGESSHPGGALDQWIAGASDVIQPTPSAAKKALQWAAMCLRQGPHWTFEGIGWLVAKLGFMRNHLCNVHGHKHYEVDGLDREQLIAWHDAHHNGTPIAGFSIPPTPLPDRNGNGAGVNRMPQYIMDTLPQSNCPGGNCPINSAPRRRGLARLFGG